MPLHIPIKISDSTFIIESKLIIFIINGTLTAIIGGIVRNLTDYSDTIRDLIIEGIVAGFLGFIASLFCYEHQFTFSHVLITCSICGFLTRNILKNLNEVELLITKWKEFTDFIKNNPDDK